MEHFEFVKELEKLGLSVRSTSIENIPKYMHVNEDDCVEIKDFQCRYINDSPFPRLSALQAIIKRGIDIDTWKHSLHIDIVPGNYEKIRDIIQGKILERAEDINLLTTVYFQLQHELSRK